MKDFSKLEWKTLPERPGGEQQDYRDFWADVGAADKDAEFKFAEYAGERKIVPEEYGDVRFSEGKVRFETGAAEGEDDPGGLKLAEFFRKAFAKGAKAKEIASVDMEGCEYVTLAAWAFEGKSLWLLFAPAESVGRLKFREETDDEVRAGFFSESEFLGGELTDYWKGVAKAR